MCTWADALPDAYQEISFILHPLSLVSSPVEGTSLCLRRFSNASVQLSNNANKNVYSISALKSVFYSKHSIDQNQEWCETGDASPQFIISTVRLKITVWSNSHPGLSRVTLRQNVPGVYASKLMQSMSALMLWSNGCHDGHDSSSLLSHW